MDLRAALALLGLPDDCQVREWHAALELLPVDLAVPAYLGHEALRERVHHRQADAVQTGRPDVHPGSEPDGLETLQNSDVFCGICGFSHQKSPANEHLAGSN